jgi:hypothetical protein
MDQINALSTSVIAIATLVATWSTWKLLGIERNREQASNGLYVWVTPDHFFMTNGVDSAGDRWLQLNARSTSNMPAFDVKVEVLLDQSSPEFPNLPKGEVLYNKYFPVLFENGKQMTPVRIDASEVLNIELREFLDRSKDNFNYREVYEFLAIHMRTKITFRDSNGISWERNINGKLKRV